VTAGQEADCSNYDALIEARDSDPAIMLADKGYDSDPIRQDLRDHGAVPEIPTKSGTATYSTASAAPSTRSAAASSASSTA
jgi:IS5 family transposase